SSRSAPLSLCPQLLVPRGSWRSLSSGADGEERVSRVLREKFPRASAIRVVDISGGCGAMYEIHIESEEFREKRTVQQHQMVNQVRKRFKRLCVAAGRGSCVQLLQALSEEIKSMHGLRIFTSVPKP
ncbi:BOLA3 protein, partial [Odontophorus gujanensis]|nr:BOLA3 protein [Odontophorus gujanensis]